ncbi:MAG TPA: hypothetical protein VKF40_11755, partial [Burkholderiales bacterium]|nr:hypothetical protein [Burkholderiales bacterium]
GSQVLINSGLFAPLPLGLPLEGGTDKNLQATLLAALDRIEDTPFGKELKEEKEQRSQQVCN